VQHFEMTIGGKPVSGGATFDVVNPATGEVFATPPECTKDQVDAAFRASAEAFESWRSDEAARREAMRAASRAIDAAVDELAPILTAEQGKPLRESVIEVHSAANTIRTFAEMEIPSDVLQDDSEAYATVERRPMGSVAIITPWNYPVDEPLGKLSPALLVGNTVVVKPSPFTPLSTLMLGQLLSTVLPPGVVNTISGSDQVGAWMTEHPIPRKVSFTGSVATGKKVAIAAAADLKSVMLELGGNDPAIILDDADPAAIAKDLFWSAFENNGQVCVDVKRVYVPDRLYDDVVEALAEHARAVKFGNGMDDGVELGPINNLPQFERVKGLVADAISGGGRAVTGGKAQDGPGYFFPPTILADVSDGQRIVDEEQFGPALPIIRYSKIEEAIARANGTHYGLGGSVWGTDVDRAWQVASRLESGTAWVNTHLAATTSGQAMPFGGVKWSGIGRDSGRYAIDSYSELQAMFLRRSAPAAS
jgi:acyl-CoA reductase-like NAD-dependent aldehyde dehydrogenase